MHGMMYPTIGFYGKRQTVTSSMTTDHDVVIVTFYTVLFYWYLLCSRKANFYVIVTHRQ